MTSESTCIERLYPAAHRDVHAPHVCTQCGHPLTSDCVCTHCAEALGRAPAPAAERRPVGFPDAPARLERMERTALENPVAEVAP